MKDGKTGQRQTNVRWLCRDCKKGGQKAAIRCPHRHRVRRLKDRGTPLVLRILARATAKKDVSALEIKRQTDLRYES